jgi:hypothetical protein
MEVVPPKYVYLHTALSNSQCFNLDGYGLDSNHEADFNPDWVTDAGLSTGFFTICWEAMQLTSVMQTKAAF